MYTNHKIKVINKITEDLKDNFYCTTCRFPLRSKDDFDLHFKHETCNECYLTFVESRLKRWVATRANRS